MESRDIEIILAIQNGCPEIARWNARDYGRVACGEVAGWVAEEGAEIAGFLVARRVVNELEILNLGVRCNSRRRGFGGMLFRAAMAWGQTYQAERVILEVRASNFAAIHFYERNGFRVEGRRPRYYSSPAEDALLLGRSLLHSSTGSLGG